MQLGATGITNATIPVIATTETIIPLGLGVGQVPARYQLGESGPRGFHLTAGTDEVGFKRYRVAT
jgi:hypothetical protein